MPSFTSITCTVLVSLFKFIPFSILQSTKEEWGGGVIRLCTDSTPPFQKIETYCIIIKGLCHRQFSFRHPLPWNECSTTCFMFFCFSMNVQCMRGSRKHSRFQEGWRWVRGIQKCVCLGIRDLLLSVDLKCWFIKLAFSMGRGGHSLSLQDSAFRSAHAMESKNTF